MENSSGGIVGRVRAFVALTAFSVRTALEAVAHNRLRAALTSLGILFGVASVIAMLAIGHGAEQEILSQMKLLGTNNVVVTPLVVQEEGEAKESDPTKKEKQKYTPGLTYADAQALATIPQVSAVSGEVVLHSLFTRDGRRRSGKLVGVDTSYFDILNLSLAQGAWFTRWQVENAMAVAIIGQGVRSRFFTTEDPIGKPLKVGRNWVTVVGVLQDRQVPTDASSRLGIRDANMDVYIPVTAMLRRFRDRAFVSKSDVEEASRPYTVVMNDSAQVDEELQAERKNYHQLDRIVMRVDESRAMGGIANVAQRMLERRHNTVVDFEVVIPELLLKQEQRTKTIFNIVLATIASISLVVGGIGIMNIMLASILERIREIGVRRAMGATQRNVLAQFLTEAVMISVAGGIAGIIVGAGLSMGIQRFAHINTLVSPMSVAVAFGVSFTVGLVFGIVPAYKAAQQDPVDCLRYE